MADPAPSESKTTRLSPAKASGEPAAAQQPVDDGTFVHTKQHVSGLQTEGVVTERFANTKLNIALINDPKNGPRFTMTKRESGLGDKKGGEGEPPPSAPSKRDAVAGERPSSHEETAAARPPDVTARNDTKALPRSDGHGISEPPATKAPGPMLTPPSPALPSNVPPPAIAPGKVPIDSAKTFVGLNGTYYDESWRWMDWRGTKRSWNWPAALSFGHWFAYRRLYGCAAFHLLWLATLTAAIVNNIPIIALILPVLALIGLSGLYGNTLYFLSFRRAVDRVTERGEGSYDQRRGQLAASGGTSRASVGMMALLSIGSMIGALYASFQARGAFIFNFWPFL